MPNFNNIVEQHVLNPVKKIFSEYTLSTGKNKKWIIRLHENSPIRAQNVLIYQRTSWQ